MTLNTIRRGNVYGRCLVWGVHLPGPSPADACSGAYPMRGVSVGKTSVAPIRAVRANRRWATGSTPTGAESVTQDSRMRQCGVSAVWVIIRDTPACRRRSLVVGHHCGRWCRRQHRCLDCAVLPQRLCTLLRFLDEHGNGAIILRCHARQTPFGRCYSRWRLRAVSIASSGTDG